MDGGVAFRPDVFCASDRRAIPCALICLRNRNFWGYSLLNEVIREQDL